MEEISGSLLSRGTAAFIQTTVAKLSRSPGTPAPPSPLPPRPCPCPCRLPLTHWKTILHRHTNRNSRGDTHSVHHSVDKFKIKQKKTHVETGSSGLWPQGPPTWLWNFISIMSAYRKRLGTKILRFLKGQCHKTFSNWFFFLNPFSWKDV